MSDMKCPICGGEMIGNIGSPICHYNQGCPIHDRSVPQEIYDLLERTRKALDVALDWLEQVATLAKCDDDLCRDFTKRKLAEIKTALEQKN